MYTVTLTFTEPLLGTAPLDKEIYSTYIAGKRLEDLYATKGNGSQPLIDAVQGEADTIIEDKGKTGFHRSADGNPLLYDYVIKGFFKDTCGMLARVDGTHSKALRAYKKLIDGLVFVFPRQIPIVLAGPVTTLERPLRAQTAQGERVALAHSEMIPAGSSLQLQIDLLGQALTVETLHEWFAYGRLRGLGQWRNASYGRFTYTLR